MQVVESDTDEQLIIHIPYDVTYQQPRGHPPHIRHSLVDFSTRT